MSTYKSLYADAQALAEKYNMLELMDGFNADLVNILLMNHIETVKLAVDYDSTLDLLREAVSAHIGFSVDLDHFISSENDKHALYKIFTTWKNKLLLESTP